MRVRTAEDFVADVRHRCDMVDSEFVDDDEIIEYGNQEIAELRGALRLNEGQPHEVLVKDIEVTSASQLYDLPVDFWELLSCKVTIGGRKRMLDPFMENERAQLEGPFIIDAPMYRLQNNQIEFLPVSQAFTAQIRYAPRSGRMRLGQTPPDSFDGYNGYEMAAIYGTCATCLTKEGSDPSFYEGKKRELMIQIKALAAQRDAGKPERVTDVTGDLDYPWGR